MMATGNVRIDAAQLTGRTRRLEVWFQHEPARDGDKRPAKKGPPPRKNRPAQRPVVDRRSDAPKEPRRPLSHFKVVGDLLRIQVLRRGDETVVKDVTVDGHVHFVETQTADPEEQPVDVTGNMVQVLGADSPRAVVSVRGSPAEVQARGLTMVGDDIRLDRAGNRLWIDGPGRMTLPVDRDLHGQPLKKPQPLHVAWQGRMNFDGRTMHFDRRVVASGASQTAASQTLDVVLSRGIDFTDPKRPENLDVARIRFDGGVAIENRVVDSGRLQSIDKMHAANLDINQHSGDILADGPGWISTVRRESPSLLKHKEAPAAADRREEPPRPGDEDDEKLTYLHVSFQRGITGDLHQREIHFEKQVQVTYGPVKDFADTIQPDSREGLGPSGVLLNCDRLTLLTMGPKIDGRQPIEMLASGNTLVEGRTFTARAHRISYAQAKDLLVLQGDGRNHAQLWRQARTGERGSHFEAGTIRYWRTANEVEVDDARFLDLGDLRAPAKQ